MTALLQEFADAYKKLSAVNVVTTQKLLNQQPFLAVQIIAGNYNFEDSVWKNLDIKTRAEMRVLIFSSKISKKMLPLLFPDLNLENGNLDINALANPKSVPVNKIFAAVNEFENLVNEYMETTLEERATMDCALDFIKVCANFLLRLLSVGYSQNFFETTTGKLEQIKNQQQRLQSIFSQLSSTEAETKLNPTQEGFEVPSMG
ncbi:hypothetical protein [Legionella brunensis]|uniref:Uncharacterized protein n=1 Tax=Legionella brunensis TaxID=29422 RepID=A0A0W0SNB4_9GAMM|nr:hypothetical protein [Legionella brunensis]KTC84903.1 hypothetical protein Lbru_1118 [Legionella brunensis]